MGPPRGRRNFNKGPLLPNSLATELDVSGGGAGGRKGRGAPGKQLAGRKHARKAAREAKKQGRLAYQQLRRSGKRPADEEGAGQPQARLGGPSAKRQRTDSPHSKKPAPQRQPQQAQGKQQQQQRPGGAKAQPAPGAASKQQQKPQPQQRAKPQPQQQPPPRCGKGDERARRGEQQVVPRSSKTKFFEALAAGEEDPDLRSEEELRRLLGVTKGQKATGKDPDGLDHLLAGITAGNSDGERAGDGGGSSSGDDGMFGGLEGSSDDEDKDGSDLGMSDDDKGGFSSGGGESDEEGEEEGEEGEEGAAGSSDGGSLGFGVPEDSEEESEAGDELSDEEEEGAGRGGGGGRARRGDDELSLEDFGEGEASSDEDGGISSGSGSGGGSDEAEEEEEAAPRGKGAAADKAAVTAAVPPPAGGKYIPPALRRQQKQAATGAGGGLDPAVERRVVGLLNRLAEANLQGVVKDIAALYATHGRSAVAGCVSRHVIAAVAEGPRSSEQFAAVAAAFIAGLCAVALAQDVGALFLEQLAARLEKAYATDDGQGCRNLTLVLAYCYSCGLLAADCCYSLLQELTRRFEEQDVMILATLLNAVGLQLRADDPAAMKDFVIGVHEAAAKARARGAGGLTKRAELMLELVMDIKNNRTGTAQGKASKSAASSGAGGGGRKGGTAAVLAPGQLKWLKGCGVDDVKLVNLSWAKLVAPNKKGMWWLPAATDAAAGLLPGLTPRDLDLLPAAGAASDDEDGGGGGGGGGAGGTDARGGAAGASAAELLRLAAAQRMNTDVRKAAFLAIMGSEDCAEACEKLLRLPLKGEQDREVVRVLVDCALHEVPWNPYYGHLAARLAAASKNHRMTLQFTVWDHLKEVEAAPVERLDNLAALLAALLARNVLPLSALKVADFEASPRWTATELFFWRLLSQQLLGSFPTDADAAAAFARLAAQKQQGQLARGYSLFLKTRVGPWLVARADAAAVAAAAKRKGGGGGGDAEQARFDTLLRRLHTAEQTLGRSQGAVLAK